VAGGPGDWAESIKGSHFVATSATWDLPRLRRDDAEASSHPLRATDDVVGLWKLFDAFWQDLSCFAFLVSAFRCRCFRCFIHIFQFYSQTRMKLLSVCSAPVSQLLPWTCVVPNTGKGCCCGQVMPGSIERGGVTSIIWIGNGTAGQQSGFTMEMDGNGIIIASFWPFHPEMMLLLLVPSMIDLPPCRWIEYSLTNHRYAFSEGFGLHEIARPHGSDRWLLQDFAGIMSTNHSRPIRIVSISRIHIYFDHIIRPFFLVFIVPSL